MLSLVATGGGLVFGGDANGRFRAFDDRTGKVLWEMNLGSPVSGFPVTFAVDGKQYVAVATGPVAGGRLGRAADAGAEAGQQRESVRLRAAVGRRATCRPERGRSRRSRKDARGARSRALEARPRVGPSRRRVDRCRTACLFGGQRTLHRELVDLVRHHSVFAQRTSAQPRAARDRFCDLAFRRARLVGCSAWLAGALFVAAWSCRDDGLERH